MPGGPKTRGARRARAQLRNSHQFWTLMCAPFALDTRHAISGFQASTNTRSADHQWLRTPVELA